MRDFSQFNKGHMMETGQRMTPRERIIAAINHQETDVLPIDFGGMRSTGINAVAYRKLKKYLGLTTGHVRVYDIFQQLAEPEESILRRMGGDVMQLHRLAPSFGIPINAWKEGSLADGSPGLVPAGLNPIRNERGDFVIYDGETPIAVMPAGSNYYNPLHHPYANCKTEADIDRIPLAEIADAELAFLTQNARRLHDETDYAILGAFGGNILEAGQMDFGYGRFMFLLAANPALIHHYFERITEAYLRDLEKYLAAVGDTIQVIQVGDDLGTQTGPQISPTMYREMIQPYHRRIYQYIREHSRAAVFLHCCGAVFDLIPDLIDAGVQILNPVQISAAGMDPFRLKREFGKDLTFWGGGANMQYTVPSGSLETIRQEVRELIEIFSPGGGFVFNQVHNIQANVAPDKVLAIYDTALEYRAEQQALCN